MLRRGSNFTETEQLRRISEALNSLWMIAMKLKEVGAPIRVDFEDEDH